MIKIILKSVGGKKKYKRLFWKRTWSWKNTLHTHDKHICRTWGIGLNHCLNLTHIGTLISNLYILNTQSPGGWCRCVNHVLEGIIWPCGCWNGYNSSWSIPLYKSLPLNLQINTVLNSKHKLKTSLVTPSILRFDSGSYPSKFHLQIYVFTLIQLE